ncbi:MAG: ABC transporter ATP-binding protein [Bryobacterales bacterium]|nr:ABC transporter ATP-binding protein [Bryobacterales bacterium]
MPAGAHLSLRNVTKRFPGSARPAVDRVRMEADERAFLALLGPSGCGKTTLLRLIAGFESPDSGSIALGGRTVAGDGVWLPPERRGVGMVFQDFALFPHLTVSGNVRFGLGRHPEARWREAHVLELVGMTGLEHRYPHELSGGQQQRVALARALAPQPQVILMDEPLSNLDVQMRLRLRQELRTILKSEGVTGVLVTHDQEEALSLADWVAVMHDGRIEQMGRPEEVHEAPATRFVAAFVTQANFVDRAAAPRGLLPADAEGEVMIRREDLVLTADPGGPATVVDRQFLGRDYCYRVESPGLVLFARTPAACVLEPGMRVRPSVHPSRIRTFDQAPAETVAQI